MREQRMRFEAYWLGRRARTKLKRWFRYSIRSERTMNKTEMRPRKWRSGDQLSTKSSDVASLAAWTVVSNVLLNLDETLTK